ncbi:hypothetical protein LCGC14_1817490, partial [marine sediment metagenome]
MSGSDFDLTGSRLQNATRVSQANEDADVVDWVKDDAFILCAMVEALGHSGASGTLQLRWRNVTDSGSFIVLSLSGELTFGLTDLVNGNAVVSGEEVCTPVSGSTLVDGVGRVIQRSPRPCGRDHQLEVVEVQPPSPRLCA